MLHAPGMAGGRFLSEREPPDGKEKPEPSKTSLNKLETVGGGGGGNLSRKSSKCDLLEMRQAQPPASARGRGAGS